MLKRTSEGFSPVGMEPSNPAPAFDLYGMLAMARRQWLLVIVAVSLALGLASVYLLSAKPTYMSKAQVLLDTRKLQVFQQQSLVQDASIDAANVESQMEVIRSDVIAAVVVEGLKLADDPEFYAGNANRLYSAAQRALRVVDEGLADRLFGPVATTPQQRTRAAISHVRDNAQVQRVRTTFVIEIAFISQDPITSAKVANALADAYILDQTQTKQYTMRRATNWLEERMGELRDRAVVAEKEVQDFRTKNNAVRLAGAVLSEQQLAEVNNTVSRTQDQVAEIEGRLARLKVIMDSRVPDAGMSAWLGNDIINRLRQQYSDVSRRVAELTARLGADHEAVKRAAGELKQIERSVGEELRRVAVTWTAELESARANAQVARTRLKDSSVRNEGTRQELGALQILENVSRTYQNLHDTFLQRYVEATTQQNFQNSEARIISPAISGIKVQPYPRQVLMMGGALGLLFGVGAALTRERMNRVLRTPKELKQALGIDCLGVLPRVADKRVQPSRDGHGGRDVGARVVPDDIGVARQVILTPFSRFTETVRSIKVAADTSGIEHRTIGVTSAVPSEGKSTVAANLAQLTANGNARTLLIDADLRVPALTRLMAPGARVGLMEVLNGTAPLEGTVWQDETTGLDFLPAVVDSSLSSASEVLASRAMSNFLAAARRTYDYVIIDFPPLSPVSDAKAAGNLPDGFVLVVEWGQTSLAVISEALESADVVRGKIIGAILNNADPAGLRTLEGYKGKLYQSYYASYE